MPDDPQQLAPRPIAALDLPHVLVSLPLWQLRVLALVQDAPLDVRSGNLYSIAKAVRSSVSCISNAVASDPAFAALLVQARAGVQVVGRQEGQRIARARSVRAVETWSGIMEDTEAANRDRIQAGRQIAEAAGLVGQPATINVVQVSGETAGQHSQRLYRQYVDKTDIVEGQVASTDDTPSTEPGE